MSKQDIDLSGTVGTTSVSNPAASGHDASDGHEHHHSHGHGGGEPGPGQQVAPGTGVRHHDHHREGRHEGHEGHEGKA